MIAAHDWVGELSSNGSIVPLSPSAALKKQFPPPRSTRSPTASL